MDLTPFEVKPAAVVSGISVVDGVLTVRGTDGNDQADVTVLPSFPGQPQMVYAVLTSNRTGDPADSVITQLKTPLAGLRGVALYGYGGDDGMANHTFLDGLLYGGAGDDTLAGGGGNDTVWGGSGEDYLASDVMHGNYELDMEAGDLLDGRHVPALIDV